MEQATRPIAWLVAALLFAGLVALVSGDDDDRPPIIVTNGSMIITDGDASVPTKPGTKWVKDSDEWKPAEKSGGKYHGIKNFAVGFENPYGITPAACASATTPPIPANKPLVGEEIHIEYTTAGGGTHITTEIHRRRTLIVFGKNEPSIINPDGSALSPDSSDPTRLVLYDSSKGYISKVTVGDTVCSLKSPSDPERIAFRLWIQPKIDK